MARRRRRRSRWSIQDFDSFVTRKVGNGYLETKRLLLGAPHLVKVLRGRGRWIHPNKLEPGESVVGFYPASAKPRVDESMFEPYRKMEAEAQALREAAEAEARRVAAEEEEARRIAAEAELASVPPPRRPPARRPWRSFERRISRSHAA